MLIGHHPHAFPLKIMEFSAIPIRIFDTWVSFLSIWCKLSLFRKDYTMA